MRRDVSVWLDCVRVCAAMAVFIGHSKSILAPDLPKAIATHAAEAVAVFFVLSGFVIRHVTLTRETSATGYLSARALRILTVAIPALALTFVLDSVGNLVNPGFYHKLPFWDGPMRPQEALVSLAFANEIWGIHWVPGSNEPYWSLAYEVPYYVVFATTFSDDAFLPGKLSAAISRLEELNDPMTVLFSQVIVDRGGGKSWIKPPRAPRERERTDEYLICHGGFIQTSTIVLDADLARRVRFDEALPFGQDTDFCIRLAAEGATFKMLPAPTAIWADLWSGGRVSSNRNHLALLRWTERLEHVMSRKSRLAYRGWHIAKAARPHSLTLSLRLFSEAVLAGAYSPLLAARVGLQVFLPRRGYRRLADLVITCGGRLRRARHGRLG